MIAVKSWMDTSSPGRLGESLADGRVRCHLSPRNCVMKDGQRGFCGVRMNRGGQLVTLNYGKSVHITEETIETEAVNHYAPGERILSLGNIGCMLNCVYCHNWKTSQAKYVDDKDVYRYTPEEVIEVALRHGIRVLSWTYNDPVVWHEFVCDTARIAKEAGLINLYKSAFFIGSEAVEELLPYIDIFSVSIKSIDPLYYKKYTTGWLEPVLDRCKQVFRGGKHLEVSTLMLTDISDDENTARSVAGWVLSELDVTVPLHFVRFHPDYKMRGTIRTPISRLVRAREIALEMGIEHVYLGNVYDTPWTNTYCRGCGTLLVTRYGLNASTDGIDHQGHCLRCGRNAHIKMISQEPSVPTVEQLPTEARDVRSFDWHGDIRSIHIQVRNHGHEEGRLYFRRRYFDTRPEHWKVMTLKMGESYRFSIAKSSAEELGPEIAASQEMVTNLHEVFDRAHFPTASIDEMGITSSDVSPSAPIFAGNQIRHPGSA